MSGSVCRKKECEKMRKNLEEATVYIKYLLFDIEATRRERNYFKRLVEKK